eukprot:15330666-Ditylum_brightwellii.AAC.1
MSAYTHLEGQFDYNKTPIAPPGTRLLIYKDSNKRLSWALHSVEGWYFGPAIEHYWCYCFHIPSTSEHRITATAEFFPQHCRMPAFPSADAATAAANNLIEALQHPAPASLFALLTKHHLHAIKELATIFNNATKEHCKQHNILLPPLRVPLPTKPPKEIQPPRVDNTAKQPPPVTNVQAHNNMCAPRVVLDKFPVVIENKLLQYNPVTSSVTPEFANPSTLPTH